MLIIISVVVIFSISDMTWLVQVIVKWYADLIKKIFKSSAGVLLDKIMVVII